MPEYAPAEPSTLTHDCLSPPPMSSENVPTLFRTEPNTEAGGGGGGVHPFQLICRYFDGRNVLLGPQPLIINVFDWVLNLADVLINWIVRQDTEP